MGHPDAVVALSSGGEITSHFSSAPFQYRELKMPGIRLVLSSYDIIGRHSVSAIVTTAKFREQNPKSFAAIIGALDEATEWIKRDKRAAAATYAAVTKDKTPTDELLAMLTAVAHPLRLRIVAELAGGRVHVSELARRLDMSRPLLYMHLDRLEKAGLVSGQLELSDDGKAMKYFELVPFEVRITAETVIRALAEDDGKDALHMEESDQ